MNETLQSMFRNVTDQVSQLVGGYVPNLLGALGILVIGWLVAVVVAAVVRGALKRTTIDNRIAAWMGASQDPASKNHDPEARSDEDPVHEVTLEPYFMSKYELTQGQWKRVSGRNPSGSSD